MKVFKRLIVILLIFFVGVFVLFFGINTYVRFYASRYIVTEAQALELENADCIVVLGAHVRENGSPSYMLESRLKAAVRLYEKGASDRFLMSGDHGRSDYDEVNNMMNYVLKESDIPKERVFLDHAGFSTYETACRAKKVFRIEKAIFVTQKYHLYRTVYNARMKGIEAYGVASDDYAWPGIVYYKFRESIATFKDFFCCLFNVAPTYLGEEIPISESAFASHDIPME